MAPGQAEALQTLEGEEWRSRAVQKRDLLRPLRRETTMEDVAANDADSLAFLHQGGESS